MDPLYSYSVGIAGGFLHYYSYHYRHYIILLQSTEVDFKILWHSKKTLKLNSSTTTMRILPPSRLPSCLTPANTHRWALNHTSQNPDLRLSMNSKTGWTPHSQRPGPRLQRARRIWPGTTTNTEFQLQSIILEIKYTWMQVISVPHVPHRNLPIAILDPSQWHDELAGTCTASNSQPPCLSFIQSSMQSSYSELQRTPFLVGRPTHHHHHWK